ncbi:hypothetical protein SCUCBS95973_007905 [Sporothrix curviconia]|uniref:Fringe-like glycosyltransferase domain-containing protein n=1 Tax=Sporothrix curviconia TaxID=1260050 RepID=A0ABP0CK01_9PEZI
MLVSPHVVQQRGCVRLLVVGMLVIVSVLVLKHVQQRQRLPGVAGLGLLAPSPKTPSTCHPELAAIDGLASDLTAAFKYSRRCVQPVFRPEHTSTSHAAVRRKPTAMAGQLIHGEGEVMVVNRTAASCGPPEPLPCEPLLLDVPQPYPATTNYSHLLFGVASSHGRLLKALDGFAHWLGGTEARLMAIVQEHDEEGEEGAAANDNRGKTKDTQQQLAGLERAYRARGVRLTALPPQNKAARTVVQNHFAVLAVLLEAASPEARWLGIVDDDTFVPSLYKLDATLAKHDHARPTWLGALSEDFDAMARWGYMAYGGAGVFVSVPLARELAPHMVQCLQQKKGERVGGPMTIAGASSSSSSSFFSSSSGKAGWKTTGDGLLRDCIYRHSTTKLTVVPGLYQHDLYGDIDGFYESGVLPLSVHHWRSWYKAPLPAMATVNRLCGDCFLERFLWNSPDTKPPVTLLSNGYSITQYHRDVPDLTHMELTWSHAGSEFDFSLGPLRPALNETQKKSYRLQEAIVDDKTGTLRQVYVYKGEFFADEMDEVFELVWKTDVNKDKGGI